MNDVAWQIEHSVNTIASHSAWAHVADVANGGRRFRVPRRHSHAFTSSLEPGINKSAPAVSQTYAIFRRKLHQLRGIRMGGIPLAGEQQIVGADQLPPPIWRRFIDNNWGRLASKTPLFTRAPFT